MKNPIASVANLADLQSPIQEPHSKSLHHPTEKHKRAHKGRPQVEMKASHGMRASAKGRDMHRASDLSPKQPGLREPSGVQKGMKGKGSTRFADQGRGGF